MKKSFLIFTVLFTLVCGIFAENSEDVTTITINNARETNYKKDKETDDDIILLEGSVSLSVEKGKSFSEIKADKVTYNRNTEMLYAEGNVEIVTKGAGASGGERTTANSLLLNSSTLEGVFDGGKVVQTQSDALNLPSGSTLIVFSDAFGKGRDNVIAFKNSSLTFCDDDNPHWHIDATRTWLLPGGEFAFFNALLYVGPVPVLYLPAFYYPKDELIFNPVFSYRPREGYSINTTTYLYGRKGLNQPPSSNSSTKKDDEKISSDALYNFMKPTTLKKQRVEGLILHNLDEDYKGNTTDYFKVMADWYSNLGFFFGAEGKFKPSDKYITDISFFLNMGFSKTLFKGDGFYYPYTTLGRIYNDNSTFLGITLPFRYAAKLDFTLSNPFRLNISLPLYSDPYYAYDFMTNRKESMDWISFLLNDSINPKGQDVTVSEVGSFAWTISGSYSPSIPLFLKPYIGSLSMNLNSSVNFSSKYTDFSKVEHSNESLWETYTPTRSFYYPSLIKPAQFTVDVSGTLFTWPMERKVPQVKPVSFPITLNKPEELKTEQELLAEKEKKQNENKDNSVEKSKESKKEDDFEFYLPELQGNIPSVNNLKGLTYNLNYTFRTDLTTQISYPSGNLNVSTDFNWNNIQSFMYILKLPFTLRGSLRYGNDFFSMDNSISYNPVFQSHPYVSTNIDAGGYSEDGLKNLLYSDYRSRKQDIISRNSISIKPFTYIDLLKNSSISWNSDFKIFRNDFVGTVDNPVWESKFVDFTDTKSVLSNSLSMTLALSELDNKFSQSLSFTNVLPPLLIQYNLNLNLRFPYVSASFGTGFYETTKDPVVPNDKWKIKPLTQSLNISLFNNTLNFSQSFTLNLQDSVRPENLRASVSWQGLNMSYSMDYIYGYDFDQENGWTIRKNREFLPTSLSLVYNSPNKTFYKWFNRISFTPTLSTSIVADLVRPTNSYFLFTPGISFKITDFLTFTFSSTTKNSVLYWYFKNEPGDLYSDWGGFPGNIFKDLFDSFRFDNQALREGSGFKLKSLNFNLTHELHDWKLDLALKIEPRIVTENGKRRYDFNPYFSVGVVWKPMDSMKTQITDEYGKWEIK